MLNAIAVLLLFQSLGEGVSYVFQLPVPGPVVGMLLLLLYLKVRQGAVNALEPTAAELLRHLSLLFVPAGVGIMVSVHSLRGSLVAVILSVAISTTLGIVVTAVTMRALMRLFKPQSPGPIDD